MGVIFCQVIKIKQLNHKSPSLILGNQKWKGADPIFINKEELIINFNKLSLKNNLKLIIFIKIINNKLIEAIVWIRKYFNEASELSKFLVSEIRGINLNKLISNPIQHPNQELDEIARRVLKNNINMKNNLVELKFKKINKKRI